VAVSGEYINRELSLLAFHRRVFAQAEDSSIPLLERFRFLCITASNLDEFFEVRVAGLKKQIDLGADHPGPDGTAPWSTLAAISDEVHTLVDDIHRVLLRELIPALNGEGVFIKRSVEWTEEDQAFLRRFFRDEVLPVLSPLRLDPSHPFPRVMNKVLHILVVLSGDDAFGRAEGALAVVPAPRALPRLIRLPRNDGSYVFAYLASVIKAFASELFPGMRVDGCFPFRVTRNSDLQLHGDDDLLNVIESELPGRRFGDEVRLEVDHRCPSGAVQVLLRQFGLENDDCYRMEAPVNMQRLSQLVDAVDRPDLKYPPFAGHLPRALEYDNDLFEVLSRHDVLLHHPYQSFAPVTELVRQAAHDPKTVAIKQTLYRTDSDSALIEALIDAAEAGKAVTVLVELKARFDEAANIRVAERLQDAGAQVVYGVVNLKTHAKMLMVVRREQDGLRHYIHLGTGNYNAKTARLYTDYGLLSSDPALGRDVQKLFLELTGFGKVPELEKVIQAPFHLYDFLLEKIRNEAENARAGKPARVRAKMNALTEARIIAALYDAHQAGVKVELLVRGACCLRPGIPGRSEGIVVRSVVGRLLEHSRVFSFENGGEPQVFLGSADWMDRNLFRRVETVFPVEEPSLRERVLEEIDLLLSRDRGAWRLDGTGEYTRCGHEGQAAQEILMARADAVPIIAPAREG
jgi:polyphosphate kinase